VKTTNETTNWTNSNGTYMDYYSVVGTNGSSDVGSDRDEMDGIESDNEDIGEVLEFVEQVASNVKYDPISNDNDAQDYISTITDDQIREQLTEILIDLHKEAHTDLCGLASLEQTRHSD
ncbi:hypothetical protein HDU76_005830, partial [Blyttiomyces sp. JEL0837]